MNTCRLCQKDAVDIKIEFGPQPILSRYLEHSDSAEYEHPLLLGQCGSCGLIQLVRPVPARELDRFSAGARYREPEAHLDQLAQVIAALPGIDHDSILQGMSYKDDSMLARMTNLGFRQAGAEGKPQLLIARHIVEHQDDLRGFMKTLNGRVADNGYILIEVPDHRLSMDCCFYGNIWEEHTVYFTPDTFKMSFQMNGYAPVQFEDYPYSLEHSLVGIGRKASKPDSPLPDAVIVDEEKKRMDSYAGELEKKRARLAQYLSKFRNEEGKIAFYGSGHIAGAFINIFNLKGLIDFVVDDDSKRQGLLMPGSRLPIVGFKALREKDIKLCLISLAPESEEKIMSRNRDYIGQGGRFESIIPTSRYALKI